MPEHIPSLSHVTAFVMKRGHKRLGVVRGHRRQIDAPRDERGFGYFYARMVSAVISFVGSGLHNNAIAEVTETVSQRQRRSYTAVANGLEPVLRRLAPVSAARVNTSRKYITANGMEAILVRPHLRLTTSTGREAQVYVHFGEETPDPETVGIVLHVLSRCFPTDDVLVIDARRGMSYSSGDVELEHDVELLLLEELDHYAALWEAA